MHFLLPGGSLQASWEPPGSHNAVGMGTEKDLRTEPWRQRIPHKPECLPGYGGLLLGWILTKEKRKMKCWEGNPMSFVDGTDLCHLLPWPSLGSGQFSPQWMVRSHTFLVEKGLY